MAVVRKKRKVNFTVLNNKIVDSDLSWGALGLLTYLITKPDNWEISVQQLTNATQKAKKHTGRDGIYSLLNELIEKGYCKRSQGRSSGQFNKNDYVIYDEPCQDNT